MYDKKFSDVNAEKSHFFNEDEKAKEVRNYILKNPNFVIENITLFSQIITEHSNKKDSLTQIIINENRKHIKELQNKIVMLLDRAKSNEILFNNMMLLLTKLINANSLYNLQEEIDNWSKSRGFEAAYLFIFDDQIEHKINTKLLSKFSLKQQVFDQIQSKYLQQNNYYLGKLNKADTALIAQDNIKIGSVAIHALGHNGKLGALIFISKDELHFQMGHGTLLLDQISSSLPLIIKNLLEQEY